MYNEYYKDWSEGCEKTNLPISTATGFTYLAYQTALQLSTTSYASDNSTLGQVRRSQYGL